MYTHTYAHTVKFSPGEALSVRIVFGTVSSPPMIRPSWVEKRTPFCFNTGEAGRKRGRRVKNEHTRVPSVSGVLLQLTPWKRPLNFVGMTTVLPPSPAFLPYFHRFCFFVHGVGNGTTLPTARVGRRGQQRISRPNTNTSSPRSFCSRGGGGGGGGDGVAPTRSCQQQQRSRRPSISPARCSSSFEGSSTSTLAGPTAARHQRAMYASRTAMMSAVDGSGDAGIDIATESASVDVGGVGVGDLSGIPDDLAETATAAAVAAGAMGSGGTGDIPETEERHTPEGAGEAAKATAAALAAAVAPGAGAGAGAVPVPAPAFAIGGGEFVSKEHRRAGPFKAVLLYLDYVRWLWVVTDKERLDREQPQDLVSERVKVRTACQQTRNGGESSEKAYT